MVKENQNLVSLKFQFIRFLNQKRFFHLLPSKGTANLEQQYSIFKHNQNPNPSIISQEIRGKQKIIALRILDFPIT